jgi:large subunit ribosomal protein L27e
VSEGPTLVVPATPGASSSPLALAPLPRAAQSPEPHFVVMELDVCPPGCPEALRGVGCWRRAACFDVLCPCSLKNGRVVIVLRGRFAGHKAVIVRLYEGGRESRKFTHAVGTSPLPRCPSRAQLSLPVLAVAGVSKSPRKITRAMEKEDAKSEAKRGKVTKRSTVKPFVKFINVNHIMPTRYTLDIASDLNSTLDDPTLLNPEKLSKAKKTVRAAFEERYRKLATAGESDRARQGATYFFRKLRF